LVSQEDFAPQVVYLDPMFPHTEKAAQVKKEMQFFRELVGKDTDADSLLDQALSVASHRVVVKRPRKAPPLAGREPGLTLAGKANRFDIYPMKSLRQ
jgi:16S rRNA (guanine1516-N2)-methyltransferase